MNIPKLRFKEFEGEWLKEELKNIFEISSKKFNPKKTLENMKCIELEHLSQETGELLGYTDSIKQESTKNKFDKGQVLFGKLRPYLKKFWITNFEGVCSSEIWVLNGLKISNNYLFQMIQTNKFNQIANISSGSKMPRADWKYMAEIPFFYPSNKSEQQKIATFLSTIDQKIEQLTKKKTLLESYKKGVMQKIFAQQIRFKRDDGGEFVDWEEKRLKDVLDYEQPTKYLVKTTDYSDRYKIPVLTAGKTFILGYTNETNGIYDNLPVIIFDDFTTANHYVDFNFKIKSSAMKLLKVKDKNIDLKFIYETMQMLHFPLGEHKRYWISEYSYLKIQLPELEEQQKIANFLTSLDQKITQTTQQIEAMKRFKKGLLQGMFV